MGAAQLLLLPRVPRCPPGALSSSGNPTCSCFLMPCRACPCFPVNVGAGTVPTASAKAQLGAASATFLGGFVAEAEGMDVFSFHQVWLVVWTV